MDVDTMTFKKRAGATDRGKEYEDLYVANLILKLLSNNLVKHFHLSSNDESFGIFDDVVLEIEYINGTKELYAIQLKHVNRGKTLTKNGLAEKRGNFSIKKYFEDFKKTKTFSDPVKLILFTNLNFDASNNEIALADDAFKVSIAGSEQENLLSTSETGRCFKFASSCQEYDNFFKIFHLYTNQANVTKLKSETMKTFCQMFSCDNGIFDQYIQFVTHWSLLEGKKDKLSKNFVKRAIAVRVMAPNIRPLVFSNDQVSDNTKIFREIMAQFQATVFEERQSEKGRELWRDFRNKVSVEDLNKVGNKYQVLPKYIEGIDDLNDEDLTKLLWLMRLCPLPVVLTESVEKIANLCLDSKFVLIGTTQPKLIGKVFQKASDLDPVAYSTILKTLKCSLQGKENETLESLITHNDDIRTIVTTNELVQMLDGSFKIGGKKEVLPIPHIDRTLTRNIINIDFLNSISDNTLVVICNLKSKDEQKILNASINNIRLVKIEDFWKNKLGDKSEQRVYVTGGECSEPELDDLCRKIDKKTKYHQFRMHEGELEWVRSKGDLNDLKEFRTDSKCITQAQLFNRPNERINIVCADPGMGKSILMKNLKNSSKSWTILMQSKDHSRYFRDKNANIDDFLDYIVTKTYKNCDDFVRKLVDILVKDSQVVFIWDGLDEVSEDNLRVILTIIGRLSTRGYTQWLASRCNLMKTLENEFNIFSRTIEQFDSGQQNSYIKKRLNCTGNDLIDIRNKIHKCINLVQYNDILGIPLQIYMFTELFRQDPGKYKTLLNNIFSITDLYRHFVDEKFNIYHRDKAELSDSNDVMMQIMERSKNERLQHYEEAALKTYLKPEILEALKVNCDGFLEAIRSGCDGVGIVVDVTDDKIASFLHNSYGEYFAASYLSKNYKKVPNFIDFIFEESYNNIRFLFDLLLAENCPAHIAVLYKNLPVLERYEGELTRKDRGGRNPLHLACSWGKRFALLNTTQEGQTSVVVDEDKEGVKEDTPEYRSLLVYLSERCDLLEIDDLFQMNSLLYGDVSSCLLPILMLSNKHDINLDTLKNFNNVPTLLYNSVKFDYSDVFEDIPFVTVDNSQTLLHVAVVHGSINCLKKILSNPEYKKTIDVPDRNGLTPFLLSCRFDHLDVIRTLIDADADITVTTPRGYSAIYIAAQSEHWEVIQLLLASGLSIDFRNQLGQTTLQVACNGNNCEMAQKLINLGANVNLGDKFGYTPLYMACRHLHNDMITLLLANNADPNVGNVYGDLPLFMAAWKGQLNTVKVLLQAGADINGANKNGHGAVHAACLNQWLEVLSFLMEEKAEINTPNKFGQTPLHLSLRQHFSEGIVLLLRANADVALVNRYGENFWAMGIRYYDRADIARMLVRGKGEDFWKEFKEQIQVKPGLSPSTEVKSNENTRENVKKCVNL